MDELIFSIAPTQVENERNFSIVGVFSSARQSRITIKDLSMPTFINKSLQFHEQLNDEDVKVEDIYLME